MTDRIVHSNIIYLHESNMQEYKTVYNHIHILVSLIKQKFTVRVYINGKANIAKYDERSLELYNKAKHIQDIYKDDPVIKEQDLDLINELLVVKTYKKGARNEEH